MLSESSGYREGGTPGTRRSGLDKHSFSPGFWVSHSITLCK